MKHLRIFFKITETKKGYLARNTIIKVYKVTLFLYKALSKNDMLLEGNVMPNKSKEEVYAERQDDYKQEKEAIFREAREAVAANEEKEEKADDHE